MASEPHDGIIDDDRVYTTRALARIFGFKQARTIEEMLEKIDCPPVKFGTRWLVTGHRFRLAIERMEGNLQQSQRDAG